MYLRKISCSHLSSLFPFIFSARQLESYRSFILTAKTPLQIIFIYSGNKKTHCIFKTWCIISVLFSIGLRFWYNFISFVSNNKFNMDQRLKFKYPPRQDTGEIPFTSISSSKLTKEVSLSESYAH
jgi:hypothetical protein